MQTLLEFASAVAAEDEMGVAVDEARRHPGAAERLNAASAIAGELHPSADAEDAAVLDRDRAVLDRAERSLHGRVHGCDIAVGEQAVPHGFPLAEAPVRVKAMSAPSRWPRLTDLFVPEGGAEVALLGAPLVQGSVTPARYDLAPAAIRAAMRRFSTYDVETEQEIQAPICDFADLAVQALSPEGAFAPIRDHVLRCTGEHQLTILLGGHNAITRPAAHGLGLELDRVGLITLDAHFDLRDTDEGLINGNPIRALLEDGLPGRNVCQIGLAPFANTARMHGIARDEGIGVYTIGDCRKHGIVRLLEEALGRLGHAEAVMIDFDIDVIDRSQCPGAPGARPGGMPVDMFFEAARYLGAQPQVKLVDLTEFDPALDLSDITALTAGRWVCEVLAGFSRRSAWEGEKAV